MSSVAEKGDAAFAFVKNVVSLRYEDIPSEAVDSTKISILTHLGAAMAASTTVPVCKQMMELAKEMGGKKESTIIAYGAKVPCYMAAFVNAALAHGLNFGDHSDEYSLHTGIAVFPAAFAVAERVGKVSGREFITAFTGGTDMMIRLGRAIHTKASRQWVAYGWWHGQILEYFPAAAVAGRLLGLEEDQIVRALGLVYAQTAGTLDSLSGIGADKAIYPSYPALAGVLSALMAQRGISGPKNSLEGKAGLFNVYFQGEYDSASLTRDLGKNFEGASVGFSAYPCSASTHAYIEIALRMVDEHRIRPDDVEAVTLFIGLKEQSFGNCEPLQTRRNPTKISEAQMSLPFAVAAAMAKGKPSLKHFVGEGFKDPEILRLSNKVAYRVDPEYGHRPDTAMFRPAMEVKLTDGRVLSSDREIFRYGNPKNPMCKEEHIEKFRDCASYSVKPLSKDRVEEVIKMLTNLEEVDDVSQIIQSVS
ncbi:MAG: MmgE/PrpD family protein [Planctomycetota bacterium]